jgi:pyridoxine/pyridoxamine 5'-phosphate oxidase
MSFPPFSETARRLLDEPNIAVIATLMPDGSPQTSAVWVARAGDDSVTFATPGSRSRSMTAMTPTSSSTSGAG